MKERILEFLKKENKSSAQLAEEIRVQPSGISHILSGRNKPSLDFVMKMLTRYPTLSVDWLLFGKGQMFKEKVIFDLFNSSSSVDTIESDKVPEKQIISGQKTQDILFEKEPDIQERKRLNIQFSKAKRIICFFDNNTFTEYFPGTD